LAGRAKPGEIVQFAGSASIVVGGATGAPIIVVPIGIPGAYIGSQSGGHTAVAQGSAWAPHKAPRFHQLDPPRHPLTDVTARTVTAATSKRLFMAIFSAQARCVNYRELIGLTTLQRGS
jgi:hypothetical protein